MRKTSIKLAAIPVALALVAGACGSDDDSSDDGGDTTEAPSDESQRQWDELRAILIFSHSLQRSREFSITVAAHKIELAREFD